MIQQSEKGSLHTKKSTIQTTKMLGKLNYSPLRAMEWAFDSLPRSLMNMTGMKFITFKRQIQGTYNVRKHQKQCYIWPRSYYYFLNTINDNTTYEQHQQGASPPFVIYTWEHWCFLPAMVPSSSSVIVVKVWVTKEYYGHQQWQHPGVLNMNIINGVIILLTLW